MTVNRAKTQPEQSNSDRQDEVLVGGRSFDSDEMNLPDACSLDEMSGDYGEED